MQEVIRQDRVGLNAPALLAIGSALALLSFVFFREIKAAVDVWNASTAYSHCYLILPMALYLLWERRAMLAGSVARPQLAWAWLAAPATLAWLAFERLGIMEGRQLAAITGVQVLFLVVLGWRLYRRVSGPLLFLFFLVPFGAFVTPTLQRFTADFSIVGLDLLSIPYYADHFVIETSAGTFFVAEACAGLRFLVASVAFGVFYALLSFTTMTRRLSFIALSIVVPIVANGFRALGIVVLGQILGSAQAAAADHVVYGWLFFSLVMVLLIALGQLLRGGEPPSRPPPSDILRAIHGPTVASAAAAVVLLLGVGPGVAAAIDSRAAAPLLETACLIVVPDGCKRLPAPPLQRPAEQRGVIACGVSTFSVETAVFSPRSTSTAMVTERRRVTQEIGAEDVSVTTAPVPQGAGYWTLVQTTDPDRVTAYASWVDGAPVSQGIAGRIAQAKDSIVGADYAPLLITISAAEPLHSLSSQRAATLARLKALLAAQVDLDRHVARLTRLPGS